MARTALLLVGTGLGLGLIEAGLRIHHHLTRETTLRELETERELPAPGARVKLGSMIKPSPHDRLVYELRPNLDVRFRDARVRTNSHGWRGPELARAKPEGTIRILGIGDSVMFGWAVEQEERYLDLLEARLDERYPERRWEVIALAAPGYNLPMEVEALQRYGLTYEPDLILYGYVANDRCLPNFVADDAGALGRGSFLLRTLSGLPLPAPQLVPRRAIANEAGRGPGYTTKFCSPATVPARYHSIVGEESFARSLAELETIGAEHGAPVVIVTHPLGTGSEWPEASEGVQVVYATGRPGEPGSEVPPPTLRLGFNDPHPNAAGHASIADRLFESLRERGVWDQLLARAATTEH